MNTNEFSEQPHDAQLDPNRAVVPNPNYQSALVEKTENNDQQVLPQVRASNTMYYYDVNSSAGAPLPPDAPPPPPGQAYQHVVQHPLAPSQIPTTTPTTNQAVVPPPPRVTTTVTAAPYQHSPVPPLAHPPQTQPYPQQVYAEPREEVVRVIVTDDRRTDRDFYYYRDGTGAVMTAWLLFGFGWLIGPLWWIGACFLGSKYASARAAGVLNLIFGIFWIVTFVTLLTWYY